MLTMDMEEIPTFNGIELPAELIRQLKMLTHTPISRLTRQEIEDAVLGFEGDAQLCEDPHGDNLLDMLHLDPAEALEESAKAYAHNFDPATITTSIVNVGEKAADELPHYMAGFSFVERYLSDIGQNMMSFNLM